MAERDASDAALAWPDDAVEVGRIAGAWGVKGWLKVQPHSEHPQALFSARQWFVQPASPAGPPGAVAGQPAVLHIAEARGHHDAVVARSREITGRDAAQALRGSAVFVSRASFPRAGSDEYYWVDLIGLAVVNRQGAVLGTVAGLIDTGPHSVLRVVPDTPQPQVQDERLIPFVAAYVDAVSLDERRITVDWQPDY